MGDSVAVIGENRKMIVFPFADVPELGRGRGNILQRYKGGGLSDACVFVWKEGLKDPNGRTWMPDELKEYRGSRAQAGRVVPRGFSKALKIRMIAVAAAKPVFYRHYVLAILTLVYVANFIDRQVLNILLQPIKEEFHVSDSVLGLLAGPAFAIFYATLGIPVAWLADRVNRRNIVAAALTVF